MQNKYCKHSIDKHATSGDGRGDIDSDLQLHSLRSKFRVSTMLKDLTTGSLREGVGSR